MTPAALLSPLVAPVLPAAAPAGDRVQLMVLQAAALADQGVLLTVLTAAVLALPQATLAAHTGADGLNGSQGARWLEAGCTEQLAGF